MESIEGLQQELADLQRKYDNESKAILQKLVEKSADTWEIHFDSVFNSQVHLYNTCLSDRFNNKDNAYVFNLQHDKKHVYETVLSAVKKNTYIWPEICLFSYVDNGWSGATYAFNVNKHYNIIIDNNYGGCYTYAISQQNLITILTTILNNWPKE